MPRLVVNQVALTALTGLLALACSEKRSTPPPVDQGRPLLEPEPCQLRPVEPSCAPVSLGAGGAGSDTGAGGQAGAGGTAGQPMDPEEPDERCLIRSELVLSCPSMVGALYSASGQGDSIDLLVAQLGRDGTSAEGVYLQNRLAYVEAHRFSESAGMLRTPRVVEPFVAASQELEKSLTLIPTTQASDTLLVEHRASTESAPATLHLSELFAEDPAFDELQFDDTPIVNASGLSAGDHGVLVTFAPFGAFTIVTGLPEDPRILRLGTAPSALVVTADHAGEVHALIHNRMQISRLSGAKLDEIAYSLPATTGANFPSVDLMFAGSASDQKEVLMYRHGSSDPHQVVFVSEALEASLPATVQRYASSDCNSFTIGLTCDDCPVGRTCQVQEEIVLQAKLFFEGDRVFVAYVATQMVETKVAERHVTPIIDVGCTCGTDSVSREAAGNHLVVWEVSERTAGERPEVVERMRLALDGSVSRILMQRSREGSLDVVLGPEFGRFNDGLGQFPESSRDYRIFRLGVAPR